MQKILQEWKIDSPEQTDLRVRETLTRTEATDLRMATDLPLETETDVITVTTGMVETIGITVITEARAADRTEETVQANPVSVDRAVSVTMAAQIRALADVTEEMVVMAVTTEAVQAETALRNPVRAKAVLWQIHP